MASQSVNDCSMQTRGSLQVNTANIDVNHFYLVENINTKQRHVTPHLFVKKNADDSSSTFQCKLTPRSCRFEAKVIVKGNASIFFISDKFVVCLSHHS